MSYSDMRIARLRERLAAEGLGALYVRNLANLCWLTAFDGVFDGEAAHAMLVTGSQAAPGAFLHTDSRYASAMKAAARGSGIQVSASGTSHAEWLASLVRDGAAGTAAIGVEDDITLAEYRRLVEALEGQAHPVQETARLVLGLRAAKDADEVRRLKAAQAITDAAFSHITGFIAPGMTEREVQIELEDFMVRHGAEGLSFPSIVATGANGASPHAVAGAARLEAGQVLVLDFGARAQGYCSDMTRTVGIGEPDARIRQAYEAVRQANEEVEAVLKPGMTGAEAQECAETVLAAAGFAG
ncbi:MAG: Xaa-Pro peptidase family protein, partial [Coriobacteriaceae bacterium]|nr:Xaa-Pro peptidase family protein [Coriobacteriaceae bacterium]